MNQYIVQYRYKDAKSIEKHNMNTLRATKVNLHRLQINERDQLQQNINIL